MCLGVKGLEVHQMSGGRNQVGEADNPPWWRWSRAGWLLLRSLLTTCKQGSDVNAAVAEQADCATESTLAMRKGGMLAGARHESIGGCERV